MVADMLCSPGSFSSSQVQKQIHKILAEVLGGVDRARASVLTPYFYTVGECRTLKHDSTLFMGVVSDPRVHVGLCSTLKRTLLVLFLPLC